MGFFSDFFDDILGFDPPKPPPAPRQVDNRKQIAKQALASTMSLERMVAYTRRGGRRQLATEQDVGMRLG
jgi:hypothetical protein